ncbi:DeoR/GlpR family DNA-binding transcription regulator [Roseibium sp.]|uniref:DeoR/GlpR family DNA-binding transcription regulator n=1 Tax=Roseibium sp. TaxID=1936156 RepID=UPI003D0EB775
MAVTRKQRRQARILELLKSSGYERIEDLSQKLSVSEQTIRRDINLLDSEGRLRRTHGGAAYAGPLNSQDYLMRRHESADVKQRIAFKVASLVEDGSSVFIDAGTTCEAVAGALNQRRDLKIVTYSLAAAMLLKDRRDFTVAIPGGFVRQVDGSVIGEPPTSFISRFRFDISIFSVSSIEPDGEMSDDDHWEVSNVECAMKRSRKTLLAVDSSKYKKGGLVSLGNITSMDIMVSDSLPEDPLRQLILDNLEFHKA